MVLKKKKKKHLQRVIISFLYGTRDGRYFNHHNNIIQA